MFTVNDISSFKNGDNLIKVRISNGVSVDEDNISIQISGLSTASESSSLSSSSPPDTTDISLANASWLDQVFESVYSLVVTFSPLSLGGSLIGLFVFLRKRRRMKIIERIPESKDESHKKHISVLSEVVERRFHETKADTFKPKRRKNH